MGKVKRNFIYKLVVLIFFFGNKYIESRKGKKMCWIYLGLKIWNKMFVYLEFIWNFVWVGVGVYGGIFFSEKFKFRFFEMIWIVFINDDDYNYINLVKVFFSFW